MVSKSENLAWHFLKCKIKTFYYIFLLAKLSVIKNSQFIFVLSKVEKSNLALYTFKIFNDTFFLLFSQSRDGETT